MRIEFAGISIRSAANIIFQREKLSFSHIGLALVKTELEVLQANTPD